MTIEEKAKAYDEALKRAEAAIDIAADKDLVKGVAITIFPELKESEDERIREWLIDTIKAVPNDSIEWDVIDKSHVLAWLEKQKEQKPITINQDEKEFLADEITAFLCNYDKEFDGEDPVPSEIAEHFYLLGKQAQEQNPAEWSEEDKHRCKDAIYFLETAKKHYADTSEIELTIEWLKSLQLQAKQEQKPEVKRTGWVARDRDGEICIYEDYPEKDSKGQFWLASGYMSLDQKSFPDLKWKDEPMEVEVTIRKK